MAKKVTTSMSDDEPQRLVFTLKDIERISKTLVTFLRNAKARCILLVDKDGHLLTKEGKLSTHDTDTITALVAGSFAVMKQMAMLLGDDGFSILFLQGKRHNIQLFLVGERTILAVIFEDRKAMGMVRVCASQVFAKLTRLFNEILRRGGKGPDSLAGSGSFPASV